VFTVYLDQNKWIDLRKAWFAEPGGDQFRDVLDLAMFARDQELASFPLGAVHYLETWKDGRKARRARLAQVMAELSRFDAIAGPSVVFRKEIESALHHFLGKPESVEPVRIFGQGVSHAFGEDLRISAPDSPDVPLEVRQRFEHEFWKLTEFWILSLYRPNESYA
jgi:hypothetical protein